MENPLKKKNYAQKYGKEWESHAEFKSWLKPLVGDDTKAFCTYCKVELLAKLVDLRRHAETKNHKQKMQIISDNQIIQFKPDKARETRTLLGVGFIQDPGIVLNIPQIYWFFFNNPDLTYELFLEDTDEASVAHMETAPLSSPARQELFKEMQLPPFISRLPVLQHSKPRGLNSSFALKSILPVTPPNEIQKRVQPINASPNMPVSSACAADDSRTSNSRSPDSEPDLPETSTCWRSYKKIPIAPSTPLPYKQSKPLFDRHSPRFIDFKYRDAQINTLLADLNRSPYSRSLFPSDDGGDDIEIGSISVKDITMGIHDATQQAELMNILIRNEAVFKESVASTTLAEHCIDTGNHNWLALLKQEVANMLAKNIIEPCSSAWTAPVVMVPKDGPMRFCVDYRRLNSITKPDIYPIPRIDDLLHAAKPTPFMSTLDLRAEYWQVKVKESDPRQNVLLNALWSIKIQADGFWSSKRTRFIPKTSTEFELV
ncbi:unnamed protein product [Euphydryas editha]|uniref:Transposon Ty3-I Gag-Pol polyprotein n=1 Tax=Euphydryas editha TaxID=104508 RepID=A0AAU9TSV2_EUPED|nr:unnamed protein product [Euphydryas editha]